MNYPGWKNFPKRSTPGSRLGLLCSSTHRDTKKHFLQSIGSLKNVPQLSVSYRWIIYTYMYIYIYVYIYIYIKREREREGERARKRKRDIFYMRDPIVTICCEKHMYLQIYMECCGISMFCETLKWSTAIKNAESLPRIVLTVAWHRGKNVPGCPGAKWPTSICTALVEPQTWRQPAEKCRTCQTFQGLFASVIGSS